MKKVLFLIIPLMIFIGCENKEDEKEVSQFVWTWKITFAGEYENPDCTFEIDSTDWAFMKAFDFDRTLTVSANPPTANKLESPQNIEISSLHYF